MDKVYRPPFRNNAEYVWIRPHKGNEPGQDYTGRLSLRRNFYRQRKLGIKDHPWTLLQLQKPKFKSFHRLQDDQKPPESTEEALSQSDDEYAKLLTSLGEPVKVGSRWCFEELPDAPKHTSKVKAVAWLEEERSRCLTKQG